MCLAGEECLSIPSILGTFADSGADHASKTYRIVQQMPSDSSEDDFSGSDDEWLPEKRDGQMQQ
ncbi:hypothetical protein WMY93_011478 [Mugilogobius chulae]|uniref:Uncharacterized protein n=1 Tax=Mugilogobius chulae TaxID=88201 RepID=A0AAW0P289_9GOBI